MAITMLLYFGLSATSETVDPQLDLIKEKISQVRKILDTNKLPEDQKPPILSGLDLVKKKWNDDFLQKPMEINAWLMYRQPFYEVTFNLRPKAKAKRLPVPELKNTAVEEKKPDYVKIIWKKNPEPDQEIARTAGYKIYRRAEGENKFAVITEPAFQVELLTPNAEGDYEYDDKTVTSRIAYTYYISALTDEPNVERPESGYEPAKEKRVVIPDNVKLEFLSAAPETGVWIKIKKFNNGKWSDKQGHYKKGELVGKGEFTTPYQIKDIVDDKIWERVGADKIEVAVFRIIYQDDQGSVKSETVKKQRTGGQ